MRILQLIDSLDAGGAERMAVSYANALQNKISFSALCATRKEGQLKDMILPKVGYLFLEKKSALDLKAILKLRSYIKKNKIEFIHAHSSSFFIAVLLKFVYPKIKIVWHDHYGNSEFLQQRPSRIIKLFSFFFFAIISVNSLLKEWAMSSLYCKKVVYLPNFALFEESIVFKETTVLKGENNKRILCLANLRPQKGHFFFLDIAVEIIKKYPDWTFHLVGKDFEDNYSKLLREAILQKKLTANIFVYGSRDDVQNIIKQCEFCILTSKSEGLPVALLEYGFNKKAVVSTGVGEISKVIISEENGYLVDYGNVSNFADKLSVLILNSALRKKLGENLQQVVLENYSQESVLDKYIELLR